MNPAPSFFPFPLTPSFRIFTADDMPPDGFKLLWDRIIPPLATRLFSPPRGNDLRFGDNALRIHAHGGSTNLLDASDIQEPVINAILVDALEANASCSVAAPL
ncbi:MAG TPA: hypothetical protein VGG59_01870, partial [Acidobacteriaceae bacterium]